jgi:restriction system protein
MAIPDFQSTMVPILRLLADGNEHASAAYTSSLADTFDLTPAERRELLPSGRQPLYLNRIAWGITHLAKAGLIERTGRGRVRITDRGYEVLAKNLPRIDMAYLNQYPEYVEFRRRSAPNKETEGHVIEELPQTPDDLLAASYQELRQALAQELLERIKRAPSEFFERVVIDLLVAMGYGGSQQDAAQAVGGSGDDGIDGIIKEDKLGLDFVYVQAKRWEGSVSRPAIQAFAGSLEGRRARKGVFITTSTFTRDALEYVTRIEKRIVLVDGTQLTGHMIDHGVGVSDVATYHVKRVDTDYFGDV